MLLYDKLIEGSDWKLTLYDSGVFGTSILSVNVVKDMFLSQYNIGTLGNMLLEPILVSFLYEYAYGKLIRTKYSDFNNTKSSRDSYLYGFLFTLLNSYA